MPELVRQAGSNPLEDQIEIDVGMAVDAYDRFEGRCVESASADERQKDYLFNKAIQNTLQQMRISFHPNERLLGSKQTISNWRRNGSKQPIKKPRSVLLAILALTGLDISKRSILAKDPVQFSPLVELGKLDAQKITNDPDEVDEVLYSLVLTSALFKSARMRVMTSWIKSAQGEDVEIGVVEYGLGEAYIAAQLQHVEAVDWCRRMPDAHQPARGRADGCVMLWSDQRSAWIVQPEAPGRLRARMERVGLATVRGHRGMFVDLQVSADRDCLEEEFRIADATASTFVGLTRDQRMRARERLIALVIGRGSRDASILAMHRCKLP